MAYKSNCLLFSLSFWFSKYIKDAKKQVQIVHPTHFCVETIFARACQPICAK
jgi:hypothetical protein